MNVRAYLDSCLNGYVANCEYFANLERHVIQLRGYVDSLTLERVC